MDIERSETAVSIAAKLRRAPLRVASGAFILNSGLTKLKADEETSQGLHGFATGTYPFLKRIPASSFAKVLGAGEVLVGGILLAPMVPAGLAGLTLAGFASGLLGLYVKTPGMHDGKMRPTQAGTPIAKDSWLVAIGTGLVLDAVTTREKKVVKVKAGKD
ncbi:hypothetical protein GIS00_02580 [Nakamurella sp. YIM 132087]|uniref:DoxX family membrane protein n=1 Tax=Nakamurella alba TaxID=2665158 RepID=A0A7K1FFH7_9ACTN|nr:hypothetical protein [Nakamurella alba]MTD12830.1 hypothetical protein [Nakamurella alba]